MKGKALAHVRSSMETGYAEGHDSQPHLDFRGAQMSSQGLPRATQLVSAGQSYQVRSTTGAAPVIAIPTTACLLGLWNGEPDNGKSYIIDSVFALRIVTSAAFQEMTILTNCSYVQIPTAIANTLVPRPLGGNRVGYGGNARVAVGITLAAGNGGAAANWFPVGSNHNLAGGATNLGGAVEVDLKGRFIIPPKCQFSLSVIAPVATAASVVVGVRWHEAILPMVV